MAEDIPLLYSLLSDVFPGVRYIGAEMTELKEEIKKVCSEMYLTYGEGEEEGNAWVDKVWIFMRVFHLVRFFRIPRTSEQRKKLLDWLATKTDDSTTQSHSVFACSREKNHRQAENGL